MPDWHAKTCETITLGAKCERPSPEAIYTEALHLAVRLMRTSPDAEPYTGLNAYDMLVSALREEEYPEDAERAEDKPWFRYLCLLCYNMMLDDHRSAPPFLRDAAAALPTCSADLLQAAERYEQSGTLRNELDAVLPCDFSQDAQRKVLDPAVREAFARTILRIRDVEAAGIARIEKALGRAGV